LVIADFSETLQTIDRYERRALSRRKFAIRDFDVAAARNDLIDKSLR
jgi:hypothetical protein